MPDTELLYHEFEHAERVMEKERRVEVLRALLEMHEQQNELDDEYIKDLRQRLKRTQTQLENMRREAAQRPPGGYRA